MKWLAHDDSDVTKWLRWCTKCPGWCTNVQDGAQMSGMVRKCPGWCANVRDDAQMSGMVRKCLEWCANIQNGVQISGMVHKCPGWCTNVRDGAQMSGMVRKCPGRCTNVQDGAQMSRMVRKCPGWCANVHGMHVCVCVCDFFWVSLVISQAFQTNLCAPWDWKDTFSLCIMTKKNLWKRSVYLFVWQDFLKNDQYARGLLPLFDFSRWMVECSEFDDDHEKLHGGKKDRIRYFIWRSKR